MLVCFVSHVLPGCCETAIHLFLHQCVDLSVHISTSIFFLASKLNKIILSSQARHQIPILVPLQIPVVYFLSVGGARPQSTECVEPQIENG